MFVVSLLPRAPPHERISGQLYKTAISARVPNRQRFPFVSEEEQLVMFRKEKEMKISSIGRGEGNSGSFGSHTIETSSLVCVMIPTEY